MPLRAAAWCEAVGVVLPVWPAVNTGLLMQVRGSRQLSSCNSNPKFTRNLWYLTRSEYRADARLLWSVTSFHASGKHEWSMRSDEWSLRMLWLDFWDKRKPFQPLCYFLFTFPPVSFVVSGVRFRFVFLGHAFFGNPSPWRWDSKCLFTTIGSQVSFSSQFSPSLYAHHNVSWSLVLVKKK